MTLLWSSAFAHRLLRYLCALWPLTCAMWVILDLKWTLNWTHCARDETTD